MKPTIRILIADDHPLVLRGISDLLRAEPDFEIVAECRDGLDAFGKVIDVVIDSDMTGGQPSTVLEVDEHDVITVIREGAGPVDGLL